MSEFILNIDMSILNSIYSHLHCAFLDIAMPIISHLGDKGIIWILSGVLLLFFPKYRKIGIAVLVALLIGFLLCNLTLKPLVARIRPFDVNTSIELLIAKPLDFSFPSGHTVSSFAAATVLFLSDKKFGFPAAILAVLIAFSRLYLYVHYPSDVFIGALLGILFGYIALKGVNYFYKKRERAKLNA